MVWMITTMMSRRYMRITLQTFKLVPQELLEKNNKNVLLSDDVLESLTNYPASTVSVAPSSNHTTRYPQRERRPPVRFGDDTGVISGDNNTPLLVVGDGDKNHVVLKIVKEAALMNDSNSLAHCCL